MGLELRLCQTSAFLITVSLGRYFNKALSMRIVKLVSSIMAWALACFKIAGFKKIVVRCLFVVVIRHILQLIVVYVNEQLVQHRQL